MGEQQLILTAALAGVATAYLDAPPGRRPTSGYTSSDAMRQDGPGTTEDGDPQEVWRRILFRSTVIA